LTKKNAQLRVEEKKKKKGSREHRTPANPPKKPTHKAQSGGYAGVQPFREIKKRGIGSKV
jgi:hypothetical protein